jgi:prolyl-tRNA editing enzyme YbaK/EbsC (Cys-tRNA(Pro) deacylase)
MAPTKLGVDDLRTYIQSRSIPAEIVQLDVPTPTVETAAQAVGTQVDQIIKSILFLADEHPVLAIACGLSNIQRRAIADLYKVGKKRVKLATPEMVLEISGYEVGAMPPFGHRQPLNTVIDRRVLAFTDAYAGGGAENVLLHLNPQDILRVTGAKVLDLLE